MAVIGVLALQGAFIEHIAKFEAIGVRAVEVRASRRERRRRDGAACRTGADAGVIRCGTCVQRAPPRHRSASPPTSPAAPDSSCLAASPPPSR